MIEGLDEFVRVLEDSVNNIDSNLEVYVNKISNRLLASVKLKSPVDTGQFRRSWKATKKGQLEAIVTNNCEYGLYLELGHRTRGNTVVEGRYILKRSCDEVQQIMGDELGIVIDSIW